MKKLLVKLKSIFPIYFLWIFTILLVGFLSIRNLSFSPSFPYYTDLSAHYNRGVASFAHFDGIHYLRLISKGYDDTGSQAFFPVYPMLIRTFSFGIFDPLYVAIFLNAVFLLITLYVISLEITGDKFKRFLILFLSFPASFFFLANYTESLFILLVVLFFHFTKSKKYLLSAIVAGVASSTRLVGVFLALSLAIELIKNRKSIITTSALVFISVSGLLAYLGFLTIKWGDPLMFFHVQSMFDNGRSGDSIVLLPQVIYRYIKILATVNSSSILFLRAFWELATFVISLLALYVYRKRIGVSALLFCLFAILLPTLSGTLSSFPRYLLASVPLFVAISQNLSSRVFWLTIVAQYGILIATIALFVQGIFIA